jgi:hypothetical protein
LESTEAPATKTELAETSQIGSFERLMLQRWKKLVCPVT